MDLLTPEARERYAAVARNAAATLVGLDFDGTLAPIVDDPAEARIHPDGPALLADLARRVRRVAVVTGRPARQVVALAGLEQVAARLGGAGVVSVSGQYGNERWSSATGEFSSSPPPEGLEALAGELPGVLAAAGAADAHVEAKGIALAVHTRRLPDPGGAFARLVDPIRDLADAHGLAVEPGRFVIEVRAHGMDKGHALRRVLEDSGASAVVFVGDDLGDVDAFTAVEELRREGMPGLLVCSGSEEQKALVDHADVLVDGPEGVMELMRRLIADVTASG